MRDKQYTGDTAAIYSKKTSNNQEYVQLNIVGYNRYFSFSDWYWSYQRYGEDDTNDPNQYFNNVVKKNKWEYDNKKIHEISLEGIGSSNWVEFNDFDSQKNFPNYLKTVSLISSQENLKKQLRLTADEENKYKNYLERVKKKTLTNDEIKALMPWSDSFNEKSINSKLNLEKFDYIFLKDLWRYIESPMIQVSRVDAGIEIIDYIVNLENKTIKIKTYIVPEKFQTSGVVNQGISWANPPRTTSFLIPVEKGKISDFNMNEWNIVLTRSDI
ncbi:hypothetical protein [Mycoplasmopsis agassizii]|uniref:Uncharacterized protein n=1 Tax=Mycoplasmopsis agassizii TaxID=33922 RepID=A0ABX4H6C8_9BACT|nr:hypothetical protein [Mycoplasmopsis agassizii]PAF55455.1 hypothetical protein CJF60_02100 [Mycoplasmopsis agassizii]